MLICVCERERYYATIDFLIKNTALAECDCLSEDTGMDKVAAWVSTLFSTKSENIKSLPPGNILMVLLGNPKCLNNEIERFFCDCVHAHVAAVVFFSQITLNDDLKKYIKQLSHNNKLAVFYTSPVNADRLEKDIITAIIKRGDRLFAQETLLSDFLFKERNMMGTAVERADSIGISPLLPYCVLLIKVKVLPDNSGINSNQEMNADYFYRQILEQLVKQNDKLLMLLWGGILVIAFSPNDRSDELIAFVEKYCKDLMKTDSDVQIKCTLGRVFQPLTMIRESFDEAMLTLNMYDILNSSRFVKNYNDLGFYRILRGSHNIKEFRAFYNESIKLIKDFDESNHSELVETLKAYVDNDFSLEKTAEALYVHKNTLRYRLARIEEVTGNELKNKTVQLNYYICFMIKRYLGNIDDQGKA